ncbi:hypothetical protein [Pantoea sp. 18069]|uniref:hypothetical protein n=1 Tax=Pantoea sp. 18069 TaxID=2681415 RepID=UPI00135B7020|nr:hypothetical protein [Pantoea sp. 18069]
MTFADQQRISIENLEVTASGSEETLCFSATVLLDNEPIACASNQGQGDLTCIYPLQGRGMGEKFSEAEEFAKSLEMDSADNRGLERVSREMGFTSALNYLVDTLVEQQCINKKVQEMFRRDMKTMLLFFKGRRLLFVKGVKPESIVDKPAYYNALRELQGREIVILDELPEDEAFQRWKNQAIDIDECSGS